MAAEQQRSAADANLNEALRELKRYTEKQRGNYSSRLLEKKCNDVKEAKEELFQSHYEYAAKSKLNLTDEALAEWINPRLDEANDALDEIFLLLDADEETQNINKDKDEKKQDQDNKITIATKQCDIDENFLKEREAAMNEIISDEDKQIKEYGKTVESYIEEIEKILERTSKSWNTLKSLLVVENRQDEVFEREEAVRTSWSKSCLSASEFIRKFSSEKNNF